MHSVKLMGITNCSIGDGTPEGMTMSRLYMNGTLRSYIHYCQLRMANGTQQEHSLIAKEIWKVIDEHFPNVVKALEQ